MEAYVDDRGPNLGTRYARCLMDAHGTDRDDR